MPLTSVNFSGCSNLTDNALAYLKKISLTSVSFGGCPKLTDKALAHLKGMPLTSVDFGLCHKYFYTAVPAMRLIFNVRERPNLTNNTFSNIQEIPLTKADFGFAAIDPSRGPYPKAHLQQFNPSDVS